MKSNNYTLIPHKPLSMILGPTRKRGTLHVVARVVLVVVAVAIAIKCVQAFFWWIVLACIAYFVHWTVEAAEHKALAMDNPDPVVYELHAEGVWAQVEEAVRTVPSFLPHVSVHIDESQPIPSPDQPLFVQANFKIFHPDLVDHKDILPNEDKSLTSNLIMRAWIEPLDFGSRLTFKWTSMPIHSRLVHDQIITVISSAVETLVKRYEGQM